MRLAYKVEVQPTPSQQQALLQHAGNARWAYNWGLSQCKAAYEEWKRLGKPKGWKGWPNAVDLHRKLNGLKQTPVENGGVPWMYEASKAAPQEALRDLDRAFRNFLAGRARYPRFKSRNRGIGGFRLTGTVKAKQHTIQLPRLGRLRIKPGDHGYIPGGAYVSASITEQAGRWFVSVVGPEVNVVEPNGGSIVGVDVGVVRLATLSDGSMIENPKALEQSAQKIRHLNKELARRKRGSNRRKTTKAKLARAYRRVRNVRKDAIHKATTVLTKSHGKVVVEDLKVANMTRRGRGKRGLNRSILDAAFGEFRRQLVYKGQRYGCEIVSVPAPYTSQTCSHCGVVDADSRLSQSAFQCRTCGYEINADLNAAINIEVAGSCPETKNARGDEVRPGFARHPSTKRESMTT